MGDEKRVLFLCTGNSARSQMAEGLLRHEGGDNFEAFSAGTHPAHVRPEAIEAMREMGLDISDHRSKAMEEFTAVSRSGDAWDRHQRCSRKRLCHAKPKLAA